jgi:hypothetical protein
MLIPVADGFYSQNDRTDWGLLNACTLHAKHLPPGPNMRAHAQLGRYFGLGKVCNAPHLSSGGGLSPVAAMVLSFKLPGWLVAQG